MQLISKVKKLLVSLTLFIGIKKLADTPPYCCHNFCGLTSLDPGYVVCCYTFVLLVLYLCWMENASLLQCMQL